MSGRLGRRGREWRVGFERVGGGLWIWVMAGEVVVQSAEVGKVSA